ncbi:DNA polymerase III delta subunit [Sinobacterium caligoides]|uniref:DNA polymerase III subunit delta n=1 Tax=Sinobacterium caligoides TaxID=933926 RepID=A0A3N2DG15_9GAMM|nr:DNA polymerase III subunit delta [Sinobacterium caligoides]ROR98737.1 DNA polymerase III delta subunit [Sinobacterium caligoides]
MKIRADQLAKSCQKGFSPLYWICGDEPLLVQESCEQLRSIALQQGYDERERYHVESGFNWAEVLTSANSLSLFASRKIIEVRLTKGKLDDKGNKALQSYLENPSPDTILILCSPKLDASASRSKGYKAIEKASVIVPVWPVEGYQLTQWIGQRLQQAGLQAEPDACQLLAERVEGNLLAAVQEIEKLSLLVDEPLITADTVMQVVADNARYTPFNLTDKMLAGQPADSLRVLNGLRAEGSEAILVLWAITREVRLLCQLINSPNLAVSFKQLRVFDRRQPLYKKMLARLNGQRCHAALDNCRRIDNMIKGAEQGNVWDEMALVVLTISGHPLELASN